MIKVNYVKVKFELTNNLYAYKSFIDLEVGDLVVVHVNDRIDLATVAEIDASEEKAGKFVICKVDLNTHKSRYDKYIQQEQILKKLEKKYRESDKLNIYRKLAETDEEAKALLGELNKIN